MKKLGFNCVKLWAVWNWIEASPGEFRFDELDSLCALAAEYDLNIIINFIPEGAPYWTWDGDEKKLYRSAEGRPVRYGGPANIPSAGWPGRCMDDPEFAAMVCTFIEKSARHFAGAKGLFSFDVWNEPHLEPMFDYPSDLLCYCENSKAAFSRWLQDKYADLDKLNLAWHRKYTHWPQVEPPPRFGTWADMLDWRKFWLDNIGRWLSLRIGACRKGAPEVPVQTHVAYSGILGNSVSGGLGSELGDEFILAKQVDFFGLSSFPRWLMGSEHYYRHFLHNEMAAQASQEKTFFQVELQGGGGKHGLLGGDVPTEEDIRIWNYNTVAAGGKGTIYWQYAPEPAGLESPGFGLTGLKGENTPRSLSAARCAAELSLGILDRARRAPITNAVYVSRKSDLLCFASERREELYAKSLSGFFKAAYVKGIPCRFFHEDHIASLPESGIKVLYLPMPLAIGSAEADAFAEFVSSGGILVSEACPGMYDETGLLDYDSAILKKLFNIDHVEVQPWDGKTPVTVSGGNLSFNGLWYRQQAKAGEGVIAGGFFPDGAPAFTEYRLGKGRAFWIGTYPAACFETGNDAATGNFLASFLDGGGYEAVSSLSVKTEETPGNRNPSPVHAPVIRLLETDGGYILVLVNHHHGQASVSIGFTFSREIMEINLYKFECRVIKIGPVSKPLPAGRA
ncbi:MAG: beta-galactosidase [Treponema sp.]|nr:beta-galactosidase [Treponema sp.]